MKTTKKAKKRNMGTSMKEKKMMTIKETRIKVRNLAMLLKRRAISSLVCLMK